MFCNISRSPVLKILRSCGNVQVCLETDSLVDSAIRCRQDGPSLGYPRNRSGEDMRGECSKASLPLVKRQPAGERGYPCLFRDIHAAGMQLSPSWDVAGSIYSRVMFGMPPGQQIQRLLRQFVDSKIKLYRQRGLKRRGRYNLIANSS